MASNPIQLNRLFSQKLFFKIVDNQDYSLFHSITEKYVNNLTSRSNEELIVDLYSYLSKRHRNEYFYQNTIFNKLILGRHSIKTTTALTQLPVGKSKADIIVINGKAVVYEIKTDLDNYERLHSQLLDYYKAFNLVSVVCSEKQFSKLSNILNDTTVGICVISNQGTISSRLQKKPTENNQYLDYKTIFKVLRKKEFETIIYQYYGCLPKVEQVFYYDACFECFKKIPMSDLYPCFINQLKKRKQTCSVEISCVPYELKSLMYFSNPNKREWSKVVSFLSHVE